MNKLTLFIKTVLASMLFFASVAVMAQAPTDNPLASFYGDQEGYPYWTDFMKWDNVIDMSTYANGDDNFQKFNNACTEAHEAGGGVLYYPAGTYEFDIPDGPNGKGLMLKPGVILRGEKPSSDSVAVTERDPGLLQNHGMSDLPTKFVMKRKDWSSILTNVECENEAAQDSALVPGMWNMIGCTPSDADFVGIAWIEMHYGFISFGCNADHWPDTWATSTSWLGSKAVNGWGDRVPDGTHPMDHFAGTADWGNDSAIFGGNRFIFGVHLKNSMIPNYVINKSGAASFQLEHIGWRFGARIGAEGYNLFIANNCISKPTTYFIYDAYDKNDDVHPQLFNYAGSGGIDVNKGLMTGYGTRGLIDNRNSFYSPNIVIKDNWTYNNVGKSYEFTGKWFVVEGNVAERTFHTLSNPYGLQGTAAYINPSNGEARTSESVDDNMCRAFDFGGWNGWIHNNRYRGTGSGLANDGEGILCQRHNGVNVFGVSMTYNEQGNTGDHGYIFPYKVISVGLFQGWNKQRGAVGMNPENGSLGIHISCIENFYGTSPSTIAGSSLIYEGELPADKILRMSAAETKSQNIDMLTACPTGDLTAPQVTVEWDSAEGAAVIKWDNVENEAAYKVQRSADGGTTWTTITYRPLKADHELLFAYDLTTHDNMGPGDISDFFWTDGKDMSPLEWRDYLMGSKATYTYKVVAINCKDTGGDIYEENDGGTTVADSTIDMPELIDTTTTEEEDTTVNIQEVSSAVVKFVPVNVYPNPATDIANIKYKLSEGETATVSVLDLTGKVIKVVAVNTLNTQVTYDCSKLAKGMYFVKVTTNQGGATMTRMAVR